MQDKDKYVIWLVNCDMEVVETWLNQDIRKLSEEEKLSNALIIPKDDQNVEESQKAVKGLTTLKLAQDRTIILQISFIKRADLPKSSK